MVKERKYSQTSMRPRHANLEISGPLRTPTTTECSKQLSHIRLYSDIGCSESRGGITPPDDQGVLGLNAKNPALAKIGDLSNWQRSPDSLQ
jgi:hypothetical protein